MRAGARKNHDLWFTVQIRLHASDQATCMVVTQIQHRFKAKSQETDGEFSVSSIKLMRKKQSKLSSSTTTTRTGMGMLLTTSGFYLRR
jgi:hypothetical protein